MWPEIEISYTIVLRTLNQNSLPASVLSLNDNLQMISLWVWSFPMKRKSFPAGQSNTHCGPI